MTFNRHPSVVPLDTASSTIGVAVGFSGTASTPSVNSAAFRDAAWRIGLRLTRSAEWSSKRCTWSITTSDPEDVWSHRAVRRSAGPWIYQGSAGIALFLSELYALTREPSLLPCVEGALEHAIADSAEWPSAQIGFHTGFTGIAYALIRHGMASGRGTFVERGQEVLATRDFTADFLGTTDVLSGAAGAIPVLLAVADWTGSAKFRDSALTLGAHIIRTASRWPVGWSWRGTFTNIRDLTGLAHGAAGFGHALVELYADSGDSEFKYAAEQAFAYEDSLYNDACRNWPDFRNGPLAELLSSDDSRTAFAKELRSGIHPPLSEPQYVRSWCHGAPGIGLARLRALEILGLSRYRQVCEIAVATTAAASQEIWNYSLCHGHFGNDATLIEASRVLGDPTWESQALARAESAVEQYELAGRPWPSGALGNAPDPSLMLGDAGIGYHLLRLADRRVPSILLPVSNGGPKSSAKRLPLTGDNDTIHRREHVRVFLSRTMEAVRRLSAQQAMPMPAGDEPVLEFARAIRALATSPNLEHAGLIDDASSPELARLDMIMSIADFTDTLIDDLRRTPASAVDWPRAKLSLSMFARLVTQNHDWDAWLESQATARPLPADVPIHLLLHRRAGVVLERRLKGLSSAVLAAVERGATLERVYLAVRRETDDSVSDPELRRLVLQVIINAYEAGIITLTAEECAD